MKITYVAIACLLLAGCSKHRLFEAVAQNNQGLVQKYLLTGTDVNSQNPDGESLLHISARSGHLEMTELLVGEGADIFASNRQKQTPLQVAEARQQIPVVWFLRECERAAREDTDGLNSALWNEAISGNLIRIRSLISNGADVNWRDEYRQTSLIAAVTHSRYDVVEYLLSQGARVNPIDRWGYTALHYAVGQDNLDIVRILLEKGAFPDITNAEGVTPLLKAVMHDNIEAVRLLIAKGGTVNIKDREDYTPLHYAAVQGNLEMVKLLVEKGADVRTLTPDNLTAMELAAEEGHIKVAEYLKGKTGH